MEKNEKAREYIFEIIEKQIRDNNPPETRITYNRLRKEGFDDFTTKQYLGQCIAVEIFGILKHGKQFDNERYVRHLKNLPEEPYD